MFLLLLLLKKDTNKIIRLKKMTVVEPSPAIVPRAAVLWMHYIQLSFSIL